MRRTAKLTTYACFIDIKKAYDTVWHAGLMAKLQRCGIHGSMYRALGSLYAGCESTIRLGAQLGFTDFFPIETGVRQGCILSPLLYSLWINDLAVLLKRAPHGGVPLGHGTRLTVLLYADDIVLLSEDEAGQSLSELMGIVHTYARRWRFEINHGKCGLMCFRPSGSALPTSVLCIGTAAVSWVSMYKYLGVELHGGVPFTVFRKRMLLSAQRASNAVSGMGLYSGKLGVPLGDQVYKAMVRPLLEYGAEVWSTAPWTAAERIQTTMAKRILHVPTRISSEAARGELGWLSMDARWQKARVIFWGKLKLSLPESPARRVLEASMEQFAVSDAADRVQQLAQPVDAEDGWSVVYASSVLKEPLPWCAQVQTDVAQLGDSVRAVWRSADGPVGVGLTQWRQLVRSAVRTREEHRWWTAITLRPSLRTYVQLKGSADALRREEYLNVRHGGWNDRTLVGRRTLTRLRCGVSELRITTGRWEGLSAALRTCPLCAASAETEAHCLLDCAFFADERAALFDTLDRLAAGDRDAVRVPGAPRCVGCCVASRGPSVPADRWPAAWCASDGGAGAGAVRSAVRARRMDGRAAGSACSGRRGCPCSAAVNVRRTHSQFVPQWCDVHVARRVPPWRAASLRTDPCDGGRKAHQSVSSLPC
jgi:hypothetical protein